MAKLICSMITSLDGYAEAAEGDLGKGAEDPEVHTLIGDVFRHIGTFLYGRRMYETMVFWETAQMVFWETVHEGPGVPPHILEYSRDWRAADEVVYSTTPESVASERTRIERTFDPEAVRRLKEESEHDLSIDGPTLAAQAIAARLVDEYHLFTTTSAVGGGKRFFPDGMRLDLELVEQRAFATGLIYAHYRTP
ncbi:dihydrofolate reductase family protein [Blastococcus sp. SYSU D00669]